MKEACVSSIKEEDVECVWLEVEGLWECHCGMLGPRLLNALNLEFLSCGEMEKNENYTLVYTCLVPHLQKLQVN